MYSNVKIGSSYKHNIKETPNIENYKIIQNIISLRNKNSNFK